MTDRGDSSSDVEDYMSEDFITVEYDVRPGKISSLSFSKTIVFLNFHAVELLSLLGDFRELFFTCHCQFGLNAYQSKV